MQWKDGLVLQQIPEFLTISVDRIIGTFRKRTVRLLMMGGRCGGGEPLDMGIIMGREGDMDGVGIEMDMIKGR